MKECRECKEEMGPRRDTKKAFVLSVIFVIGGIYDKMLTFVPSRWWLQWVELCPSPKYIHREPKNVTLFGKRVFAVVIELRISRSWIGVVPKVNDKFLPS